MKIWVRIFMLSVSISLVAILVTGAVSLRTSYRSLLDGEVRSLMRVASAAASVAANQVRTARFVVAPDAIADQPATVPDDPLAQIQGPLVGGSTGLEIYSADLRLVYSEGHGEMPPAVAASPELSAAAAGRSTYVVRRPVSDLILFLASPERIVDQTFIVRASVPLDALDDYGRSQLLLLGIICAAASIFLCGAAFVGSRAIARGMEVLALQAGAIAAGDYRGRAFIGGRDEVATLARELNRMADSVEAAVMRLRSEKADRQAFIDDLTHELRTPVTSIVGFSDHLRRHSYDEAIFSEGLTRIHDEGLRILTISESLKRLLLSRTQPKELKLEAVVVVVQQAAAAARERSAEHEIVVEVQNTSESISIDHDLMITALGNLLDNAMRASVPGSPVTIGFFSDETARWLFVRDSGGADRIPSSGFGLGKSICREIAEYHGARLEYRNEPGGGTLAMIVFANLQ